MFHTFIAVIVGWKIDFYYGFNFLSQQLASFLDPVTILWYTRKFRQYKKKKKKQFEVSSR